MWVGGAPGSGDTFFVVEQGGRIWSVNGRARRAFLDVRAIVCPAASRACCRWRSRTDYAHAAAAFYVYFVRRNGNGEVRQYRARSGRVVAGSGRVVIRVPLSPPSATNHNGGNLWTTRQAACCTCRSATAVAAASSCGNSQRMDRLMGKLIRITPRATGGYLIPRSNPFFARRGTRREIYALGLRNPWRFSIDGADR